MSNSPLISGTLLTNNCSKPRNHKIDRITPHYMAWYTSAKTCCQSFVPASRRASANYCIGKDGEIWLNVEEKNRAWTTASSYNDNRAVTIECANYMDGARYGILPDATWNSLVRLCADICTRNGIERLNYTSNDKGNLTMHKWYADTDCPGPWLSKQFGRLANEVNALIKSGQLPLDEVISSGETNGNHAGRYVCVVNNLNVRTNPSLNSKIVAQYHKGETVVLDSMRVINDGYVWGRYIGFTSGEYRYVAIGPNDGKEPSDNDYLVKQ